MQGNQFIRPYRGGIPPKGWHVVNVPGIETAEVTEDLANGVVGMLLRGNVNAARDLMLWFGGKARRTS